MKSEFSNSSGTVRYHIDQQGDEGDEDKPVLLMLAGLASDHRSWGPIVPKLTPYFHLIMPDNRFCGRTQILDNADTDHFTQMVDDYAAFLQKTLTPPVYVLGHSMGAKLGLDLAARYPACVKRLVLAAGATQVGPNMGQLLRDLSTLRTQIDAHGDPLDLWYRLLFQWLFAPNFFDDERTVTAAAQLSVAMPDGQSALDFAAQVTMLLSLNLDDRPAKIDCPTLLINGAVDRFFAGVTQKNRLLYIKHHHAQAIDNAGHSLHWDQPDAFCDAVIQFLRDDR